MRIVLASLRVAELAEFSAGLEAGGARVEPCATGAAALEKLGAAVPDLVVVDSGLPDFAPAELVLELLKKNAAVQTAVLSRLPEEAFHAAAEGLGILARVPWNPGREDAAQLLETLRSLRA